MTEEATAQTTAAKRYPIVKSTSLSRAQRSGLLGLRKPSRPPSEMVQPPEGHHVLVYRVDGEYVLDDASLDSRNDVVVRATHVSVVDTQRNAPIVVQLSIPAKQSQSFAIKVTFGCTVVDPLIVVRQGLKDPEQLLTSYLLSYHNVMQMGLDFTIEQINEVRHAVHDELTAYQTVNPPLIDGLEIVMSSVEVLTPRRMAERHEHELEQQDEHLLRMGKLLKDTQHELAVERSKNARLELERQNMHARQRQDQDHEHVMAEERQSHDQKLGADKHEYEYLQAAAEQSASLARQRELNDFRRVEVARHMDAFGSDADAALYGEYVDGGMSQREIAAQLRGDRERRQLEARDLQKAEREKEREERDAARERDREDREAARLREREGQEAARESEREEQARKRAAEEREHELQMKKLDNKRERDIERARSKQIKALVDAELANITRGLDRETAEKQRESVVAVISSLANRGHLDMVNIDVEGLLRQVGGGGDVKKALEAAIADTTSPQTGAAAPTESAAPSADPASESAEENGPFEVAEAELLDDSPDEVHDDGTTH
jgi:hypothetical protein